MGTERGTLASLAAKGMTLEEHVRGRRPPPRQRLPQAPSSLFAIATLSLFFVA